MQSYHGGEPLEIGPGPHLFLDDAVVEDRWALTRTVHPPYPHLGNPIIVADRPWEERPYRPQVFYDERIGRYRMYYQCFSGSNYWSRKGPSYFTGYAESNDGLNWEKPLLPDSAFDGHPATNVISMPGADRPQQIQAPWIFVDPNESDESRAYKMIYNAGGLRLAYSADGISWRAAREEPLFTYHSDTMNHVIWNERIGKWMLYMRPPMFAAGAHEGPGRRHYRRRTAVSLSDDLFTWTTPRTILYPDELDTPDFDATHVWKMSDDRYVGFVTLLYHEEGGTNDVMLATSSDGFQWTKPLPRQIWLPRGPEGSFDAGCASIGGDPIRRGLEYWFYTTGFQQAQAVFDQDSAIGLYKMGMDRFVSLRAPEPVGRNQDYGYLLTKEFIWRGKRLVVNCAMGNGDEYTYGALHVEIVRRPNDANPAMRMGEVVEGYSLDDCELIRSNSPSQVVRWNGSDDLSAFDGQPVYLRFRIRNGGLFSFSMESE